MGSLHNILPHHQFKQIIITENDREIFKHLDNFLAPYNEFQKKSIISTNQKILCVAGAGSGKTTVLTKRIEFLIKYKKVDPAKILAITFTRKARYEMQQRLSNLNIHTNIETFNSFCEKILQKYQKQVYGKTVRLMDHQTRIIAFSLAIQTTHVRLDELIDLYFSQQQKRAKSKEELTNILLNDCFFIIDYCKLKKEDLSLFFQNILSDNKKMIPLLASICKALEQYISMNGFRTYNDQIYDAVDFLKKNKAAIPQFDHILVDEYQDVNKIQVELLDILSSLHLFIVGDPRQSIFGWRGSDTTQIINFLKKFPQTEVILLTKNYRSTQEIVNLINVSIKDLLLPDLEGINPQKNEIFLNRFDTEIEESHFITQKTQELDYKKNKTFVLTRTNKQANTIAALFKQKNIPASIKKEDDLSSNKVGEVTISTIHAVKGLEADIVFVLGCTEQNFPCKYSDNPLADFLKTGEYDKEAEEKRLFYVALSRAKNNLYLSYSGKKPTKFITDEMKSHLTYVDHTSQKELFYPDEEILQEIQEDDAPSNHKEDWDDMISD